MIRTLAVLFGIATLLAGTAHLWASQNRGFPSGPGTEFDRVLQPLDFALGWITILLGLTLLALATFRPHWLARERIALFIATTALLWVGRAAYAPYLKTFLNYGQGG